MFGGLYVFIVFAQILSKAHFGGVIHVHVELFRTTCDGGVDALLAVPSVFYGVRYTDEWHR